MKTYQGERAILTLNDTDTPLVSVSDDVRGFAFVPLTDIIGFLGELGYVVLEPATVVTLAIDADNQASMCESHVKYLKQCQANKWYERGGEEKLAQQISIAEGKARHSRIVATKMEEALPKNTAMYGKKEE